MGKYLASVSCTLCVLAVVCSCAEGIVNVTIYNTAIDKVTNELQGKFEVSVTEEAEKYCSIQKNKCPADFQNVNLTTSIDEIIDAKPSVNLTITITVEGTNNPKLPDSQVVDIIKASAEDIETAIDGREIVSCNQHFFGIEPDNPTNWIIISTFCIITLVLLIVVLLLSKNKANPKSAAKA